MGHRINVIIQDSVWEELQSIPRGDRSRVVNQSLERYLKSRKRLQLLREMDEIACGAVPGEEDSVELLRKERYAGRNPDSR